MRATALAVAAIAALATLGCASLPPIADPDGPYAQGERTYRSHCAACHRLRAPSSETRARWAWAVEKYAPRARLGGEARREVLEFLQAYAKDAPPLPPPPAPAAPATPSTPPSSPGVNP